MPGDSFKNKIRIRANGILQADEALLLVQLHSPVTDELVWMPPGGGLEFGERMEECLQREFLEETGVQIKVGSLAFVNELVQPPYHAVEFYFNVQKMGGTPTLGHDPELSQKDQLLQDLQWIAIDTLAERNIAPPQLTGWLHHQ